MGADKALVLTLETWRLRRELAFCGPEKVHIGTLDCFIRFVRPAVSLIMNELIRFVWYIDKGAVSTRPVNAMGQFPVGKRGSTSF